MLYFISCYDGQSIYSNKIKYATDILSNVNSNVPQKSPRVKNCLTFIGSWETCSSFRQTNADPDYLDAVNKKASFQIFLPRYLLSLMALAGSSGNG